MSVLKMKLPMIHNTVKEFELRLGILLSSKLGTKKAFEELAATTYPTSLSLACSKMVRFLEEGKALTEEELLHIFPFFSDRTLAILASSLPETIKGKLLTSWHCVNLRLISLKKGVLISFITFLFSGMCLFLSFYFFIPQFIEIFHGLELELPIGAELFYYYDFKSLFAFSAIVIPFLLLLVVNFAASFIERVLGAKEHCDRANLYRMLALIPHANRLEAINSIANKSVFYTEATAYKNFANRAIKGEDLKVAAVSAGLGSHFAWLLQPTEDNGLGAIAFNSLADLHLAKLNSIKERVASFAEVFLITVNGIVLGFLAWYVYHFLVIILSRLVL